MVCWILHSGLMPRRPYISFSHEFGFCAQSAFFHQLSCTHASFCPNRHTAHASCGDLPLYRPMHTASVSHSIRTFFAFFLSTERVDESNTKAPTATSKCQLTTSEDAWVVLATAILPGYRVKVHKCTSLWLVLYLATVI